MSEGKPHFLILPVCLTICGKPHQSIYKVSFNYIVEEGHGQVGITSMNEIDEHGNTYIVDNLIKDGVKGIDNSVIDLILSNKDMWDKEENWWR